MLMSGRSRLTQRLAAETCGAHDAPCGQVLSELRPALMRASRTSSRGEIADDVDPSGKAGRHVLGGMHGEIDAAFQQRRIDLLGEQSLAAGLRSARSWIMSPDVLITTISTPFSRPAVGGRDAEGTHLARLPKRKRASTRTDPKNAVARHSTRPRIPGPFQDQHAMIIGRFHRPSRRL